MSNVTLSINAVPKGERAQEIVAILGQLSSGDISHLHPVEHATDARLRAITLQDGNQALFFSVSAGESNHLVFVGAFSPQQARDFAERKTLRANPINGVMEIIDAEDALATPPPAPEVREAAGELEREPRTEAAAAAKQHAKGASETSAEQGAADEAVPGKAAPGLDTSGTVRRQAASESEATDPGSASARSKRSNVGVRLVADGHTPESLYRELGLSPKLSAAVMRTTTPTALFRVLDRAPVWQREALMALTVGQSIENIREELALGSSPDASLSADEQILVAAQQPASRMEFAYTEDAADLREAIENADYGAWRIYLHPSQQQLAKRWYNGPGRVFGGAGTGKTVVAVHRARNLALGLLDGDGPTGNRIIVTTYTKGLAGSLKKLMAQLEPKLSSDMVDHLGKPGIMVAGIDAIARKVLTNVPYAVRKAATESLFGRAINGHPDIISARDEMRMLDVALTADEEQVLTGAKREVAFLLAEWVNVVLPNKVTSKAQYARVKRTGRGVALNRTERLAVWKVLDAFRTAMAIEGRIGWQTHSALAAAVIEEQVSRETLPPTRYADHIVIDEAQDFHAGHWLLVRALVPEGPNDIFLAEDAHQRIYGSPLVLQRFGITTRGRSRGLSLNYRTTAENLDYANTVLTGEQFQDSEGETNHELTARSLRSGPEPQIVQAASLSDAMRQAVEYIHSWQALANTRLVRIGVLVREHSLASQVISALTRAKVNARQRKDAEIIDENEVAVLTMHAAKGLEFTHVILVDPRRNLDHSASIYGMQHLDASARRDAERRERSLVYVASSRARDELVVFSLRR